LSFAEYQLCLPACFGQVGQQAEQALTASTQFCQFLASGLGAVVYEDTRTLITQRLWLGHEVYPL